MKNNNQHNEKEKLNRQFLEQFPEAGRPEIEEVWKHAGTSERAAVMPASEVEEALENVQIRLQMGGEFQTPGEQVAGWIQRHTRILVAAVVLFSVVSRVK